MKNYYQVLGIAENAEDAVIKKAFRELARKYHPDVAGAAGEEKFKEINEAYDILSDPKKRAEYDRMRRGFANREARSHGPGYDRVPHDWGNAGNTADWGSIFDDLFSNFSGGNGAGRPEASIPEETVALTLEQVATGTELNLSIPEIQRCPVCHGTKPDCSRCGGVGQVQEHKKFAVKIPQGVADGDVIRVGEYARLKIQVSPHPRFVRQGDNLMGRLVLTVPVAAVGGQVDIAPLVGKSIALTIPPHTNYGKTMRLKGLGLPKKGGAGAGDLLLEVALRFPEPFSAQDDALYQDLLKNHREVGGEIHAPR